MKGLVIIRGACEEQGSDSQSALIPLRAERATLAKRRWRGVATNGREFGFDLERPLAPGDCFHIEGQQAYLIEQMPEDVLEVALADQTMAARVAWHLGNLHLLIQVLPDAVRVGDDPAARKALAAVGVPFAHRREIFQPLSAAHPHHHDHGHE